MRFSKTNTRYGPSQMKMMEEAGLLLFSLIKKELIGLAKASGRTIEYEEEAPGNSRKVNAIKCQSELGTENRLQLRLNEISLQLFSYRSPDSSNRSFSPTWALCKRKSGKFGTIDPKSTSKRIAARIMGYFRDIELIQETNRRKQDELKKARAQSLARYQELLPEIPTIQGADLKLKSKVFPGLVEKLTLTIETEDYDVIRKIISRLKGLDQGEDK